MIVLDLSILNQKGTPMFNSDTFANRPTFGIVGRIFISIDTAAIYRDTGTAWDLIADGGSSSTNIYNSNGTLSANRVVSDGGFGLSFTPTTHIGTAAIGGGGNGKLIVGSSTADNGIQIFGANSPSLRIDNAQSGGTQRFVFGLSTATNNFIQGATAGEFCISTQSAGNMLFGMWQTTNASEVMRITTANNLLVGSINDTSEKLQITGVSRFNGNITTNNTFVDIGTSSKQAFLFSDTGAGYVINMSANNLGSTSTSPYGRIFFTNNVLNVLTVNALFGGYADSANDSGQLLFYTKATGGSLTQNMTLKSNGNLLVGTVVDSGQKFYLNGSLRIDGQTSGSAGGSSGQHLIINCDGTNYKIALLNT